MEIRQSYFLYIAILVFAFVAYLLYEPQTEVIYVEVETAVVETASAPVTATEPITITTIFATATSPAIDSFGGLEEEQKSLNELNELENLF